MRVVVDTGVWSLLFRRRAASLGPTQRALVEELLSLIQVRAAALIGLVRQELLSGIREAEVFEGIRIALREYGDEPVTTEDHEEAARCSNRCRQAGVSGSAVDFLLCAVAIRRRAALFTTDSDFQRFAKHLPLRLHAPRPTRG